METLGLKILQTFLHLVASGAAMNFIRREIILGFILFSWKKIMLHTFLCQDNIGEGNPEALHDSFRLKQIVILLVLKKLQIP